MVATMRYFKCLTTGEVFGYDPESQPDLIATKAADGDFVEVTGAWPPEPSTDDLGQQVRTQRNRLLRESDWTQLVDCPLSDSDLIEWQAYRQELRDVTEQESFPLSVTWPTAPN